MIWLHDGHVAVHPIAFGVLALLAMVGTASLIVVGLDEVRLYRQRRSERARRAARRDAGISAVSVSSSPPRSVPPTRPSG